MTIKKNRQLKIWLFLVLAVLIWVLGIGFYRDISANNEEVYEGLSIFSDVIELVEKNYVDKVETKKLIEDAIQGMVHSLDPHSSLLVPEAFEELQIDTQGEFTGIGIHVTMRDSLVTVISPIEGTPAHKAGVKAGDKIIKVDGVSTDELRDAVNRMRGPKGTSVVITIIRKGAPKPIDFALIRDVIPIESVRSNILKPGYGYVRVTNFRDSTTKDLVSALEKLEAAEPSLKGLILDLRDNPGGILNQAIKISDLFLETGEILSIKGRLKRHTRIFEAHTDKVKRAYPLVVLINGGSASASEIVAGALQDQKRALILGTTSFGKGSVQTVEQLRNGYGLKFTIARYYTPSGRSIQAKGVEPDITVSYKKLDNSQTTQGRRVKESDLKNHLNAEPEIQDKKPNNSKDELKKEEKNKNDQQSIEEDTDSDSLILKNLLSDNQVMRALDILISYEIFKDLKNG